MSHKIAEGYPDPNTMTLYQELAHVLGTRPRGRELPPQMEMYAKNHGLVIVYGAEHRMCLRGAMTQDIESPKMVYVNRWGDLQISGVHRFWRPPIRALDFAAIEAQPRQVEPYEWTFVTTIPHATFDVSEPAGLYCRGLVFALSDLEG